jgi:hypothetical protein
LKPHTPHRQPAIASRSGLARQLRILALLLVLLIVAVGTWRDRARSTQWRVPLFVAIYPIAADDSPVTQRYVASLDAGRYADIDQFFAAQAHRHGITLPVPLQTRLKTPLAQRPPERAGPGALSTLVWSLKLRFWAWRRTSGASEPADVRVFVLYHDPAIKPTVPHSAGLAKGMIGVVHAFAQPDMDGGNGMVIAHEIMHTLGATDKYDPDTDAPRFPDGYGDPLQSPRYPQRSAELMGGRRALTPTSWEQPSGLAECVIGAATADEIRWSRHAP